ncbi:MAG: molybdate ABC transporter substrate-binding protein [Lachnospiraceae bacterium]|nr:molybdate ABC transporter substrate-binding protein [Lachnospiraceae bacterium]
MKEKMILILVFVFAFGLFGCGGETVSGDAEKTEIIVFAAASMSGALEEVAALYMQDNPNAVIIFNFDSSGTLSTQIQERAEADVFISAALREMEQLSEAGLVVEATRVDFLENKTVLVVAPENPKNIKSFQDMAEALLAGDVWMAMGNMDVPVGRYAQEILTYFGLDHEKLATSGVISYGFNVREVAGQVREASVDMGMVYLTDAVEFDLKVVDVATVEMAGRVIYPAAILYGSQNPAAAESFLDFMTGETAMEVFVDWGFSPFR